MVTASLVLTPPPNSGQDAAEQMTQRQQKTKLGLCEKKYKVKITQTHKESNIFFLEVPISIHQVCAPDNCKERQPENRVEQKEQPASK